MGVSISCTHKAVQHWLPCQKFTVTESNLISQEIDSMLRKGVLQRAKFEPDQILSGIFLRPKKDGTHRLILNLKKFNESVEYHHFKMDSLNTITKLVSKNCFMASIDLKDAYYSVPVRKQDRKLLRFQWNDIMFEYTCLPNGLSSSPRIFTKILKPPLAELHKKGHISLAHLDDIYFSRTITWRGYYSNWTI